MANLSDLSSLSNPSDISVKHLEWKATVDFKKSILKGTATYKFTKNNPNATSLCLDTSHLLIHKVHSSGTKLAYKLHAVDKPHLGAKLEIFVGDHSSVSIEYQTTSRSSALQWLPPSQTSGKKYPYLFTQCQAIHARTMIPCQDRPGVKTTYVAEITVPVWATCVMSALGKGEDVKDSTKTCYWYQSVPVSSYLIAMAVGDLTKVDLSDRCAIWSEPSLVQAAAYEFAQTEDFLQIAEELAGTSYVWGRYDLLCLPPSFPYGGMENPCLTFVTPTLLAGDRSLADVVAHEIAHSWTGNLITNATWEHFWLNEGWTTWFQRKIMAKIHKNPAFLDFDAIGGFQALEESCKTMPDEFSSLVAVLGDLDPDDYYSSVPYEKGFNLLLSLERRVGSAVFEDFFQAYVKKFAYKTLTSDQFRDFVMEYFADNDAVSDFDWEVWYHQPGMPPETPIFDRSLAEASETLAAVWLAVDQKRQDSPPIRDMRTWSSNQITCFLDALLSEGTPLKLSTIKAMNDAYGFAGSKNSEILHRYCQLAIAAGKFVFVVIGGLSRGWLTSLKSHPFSCIFNR
jgi:leukotriene-A4 hydrolase